MCIMAGVLMRAEWLHPHLSVDCTLRGLYGSSALVQQPIIFISFLENLSRFDTLKQERSSTESVARGGARAIQHLTIAAIKLSLSNIERCCFVIGDRAELFPSDSGPKTSFS